MMTFKSLISYSNMQRIG